jgi:glycosyltransferase involved in cell wall biosynthesis
MAVGHSASGEPGVEVIPNFEERTPVARGAAHLAHVTKQDWIRAAGEPLRSARVRRGEEDFDFPGTWKLVRSLDPPPDVIHALNLHGGYFDMRALPELSRIAPLILSMHDMWLITGHVAHSFECERWRTGCGECPHLDTYVATPRDRSAFNWRRKRDIYARSRLHVATSAQWLQDHLDDSILAAGMKERRLIPTGIDLERFSPGTKADARRSVGLPDDGRPVLVFAANATRSNQFKDFATLEAAIGLLTNEVVAVSVGEAGETQRIGAAERRMVGHTDRLDEWYRAADVYVHPARADTFPTTVLEALASGLPVVGSAVNGIPEQVKEGETGHLVRPGDPEAMARAIDAIVSDPQRLAAMSAAARADAVARFDHRREVDDYEAWYESLVASISDSSRMRSA